MHKQITKAVFPVAGLGTRFLPVTKASPKEMLPIVDKPLIQYAVEEAMAAGITDMIFVTGRNKRAIEDHFDKAYELEAELIARDKQSILTALRGIKPDNVQCFYVRQAEALGLGHAVLCAERLIGDEPFAVVLADDLLDAGVPVLKQMVDLHAHYGSSIIGVESIRPEQSRSYGVVAGKSIAEGLLKLHDIVEKPAPADAPSDMGVVGRYIMTSSIFRHLREMPPGAGGELQLTDGIARLLRQEAVLSYRFEGKRYDCGSKQGYLQATVELALRHPEVREEFRQYLLQMQLQQMSPSGAEPKGAGRPQAATHSVIYM
ncbi:UTP--glucose-1-phosphate uridylyltransferase GalU [Lacisediminimonas sp.]|uniref:UTP--glucose-1-phosphate uridylyltransferase GalU n=1 Tax=Lacisediminimonas sp. TaxID=3060582 RepID=UPI0027245B2D|nr:UTP--glucose-1-phosphate uridylyltransferase GalU [Lacisediminimonas sp.]MDO8301342.1 UTP--glucose-1-phosphate uridylyltransferase GalU [Lacisediminimonas sp.]